MKMLIALLAPLCALAAGNTVGAPGDNSRLVVENAVANDNSTALLFWTRPDLGDRAAGQPCPLDFYTITLRPGLPSAPASAATAAAPQELPDDKTLKVNASLQGFIEFENPDYRDRDGKVLQDLTPAIVR